MYSESVRDTSSENLADAVAELPIFVTMCAVRKFRHFTLTNMSDWEIRNFIKFAVDNAVDVIEESVNSDKNSLLFCFPVCNKVSHNNLVFVAPNLETVLDEEKLTIVTVGASYMYRETFPVFDQQNRHYYDLDERSKRHLPVDVIRKYSENYTDRNKSLNRRFRSR